MLPKLRRNPSAYSSDFEVFMNGKLTSWGGINWNAYGKGKFPFTFRQKPGPKNALGKVKFMLPNPYNIYLHDTPSKDKFLATTRAFSHGCIRLSRPMDLAYHLVGDIAGWSKQKIDAAFASGKTTRVRLPENIPVHLIYVAASSSGRTSMAVTASSMPRLAAGPPADQFTCSRVMAFAASAWPAAAARLYHCIAWPLSGVALVAGRVGSTRGS